MKTNNRSIFKMSAMGAVVLCVVALFSGCVYMKMDPPADADKTAADGSCYMATAANMLAGAGYGDGTTLQARAEDIYNEMKAHLSLSGGWTDAAISWWLSSSYNTWTSNPYQVVTVHGNKVGPAPSYDRPPWTEPDGPLIIGNELRKCNFVGLSISWPTSGSSIGTGGHAITCWGDNGIPRVMLKKNPTKVRVTDSDTDAGGDVQIYTWDDYTSPNPSGPNEGNGWYMDYSSNHPYIKHIAILSPIEIPGKNIQRVTGSYRIHQDQEEPATDLHYLVGSEVEILTYHTEINQAAEPPNIDEYDPRTKLEVDWIFDKPIEYCTWVTITTEFILSNYNAIYYDDVHFTYAGDTEPLPIPSLRWEMQTQQIQEPESIANVTGGYVVGSFEIAVPGANYPLQYRFIHEYRYDQDPNNHTFYLSGEGVSDVIVKNFQFGHSYGYLDSEDLWLFGEEIGDWLYQDDKQYPLEQMPPIPIGFDLPYPPGDI